MNVPMLLNPKQNTTFILADKSILEALAALRRSGFSSVPVITERGKYYGTVYSSDFLDYILDNGVSPDFNPVAEIVCQDKNPAVNIDADLKDIYDRLLDTNFVPVVDGRGCFVGIVTRKGLMTYLKRERIKW